MRLRHIHSAASARAISMLKWIRNDGSAIVEQYLPSGANVEVDESLVGRRHDVDMNVF
ncbi:unnamed protein product [Mycetohabitans rhizoxinica HKI 454]|uniref:Transposase n=1 Tax=Mycetohabitans rhizoxinica (strain DSM 19002 / CIP 109453 / HKI 454) TaxID=882378 RepID=E5AR49_MYCRK|nr:unnamed protein product [Mycetohabitans rhizoxinica HKI 454]